MAVVFYGDNSIATLKNAGLGVCFGQCTFYAKISKDRACVQTDASTIQSNGTAAQALFRLGGKDYYPSRDRIFGLHGLTAGAATRAAHGAAVLAGTLLLTLAGQIVFINVTMPGGASHVVAANLKNPHQLEYFDPNDALYRVATKEDFAQVMVDNFTRYNMTGHSCYPVN